MKQFLILWIVVLIFSGCVPSNKFEQMDAKEFLEFLTKQIQPLITQQNLAYWNATATGEDYYYNEYTRLDEKLTEIYSNKAYFEKLKTLKNNLISNPEIARAVDVLYLDFIGNQTDPALLNRISQLETEIEKIFNTFRGKIGDKEVSSNDIRDILSNSNDIDYRRQVWEASKQVGPLIADSLLVLAKLRNQSARAIGFANFYQLKLAENEIDVDELMQIFDELNTLTAEPFREAKKSIDKALAVRFKLAPSELKPWNYTDPFFQEAPVITEVKLDPYYKEMDVVDLAKQFFNGIGLDVNKILANSDLYERDKKYPHAYSTDIDRCGDVRIMTNVRPTESWMSTMLHELGHAVYDENIDPALPYSLRQPAHSFTTEAVAIFFERLSKNPIWMQKMLALSDKESTTIQTATREALHNEKLIFSRWSQVMLRFEKALYENPEQDLNQLWWNLVEEYQLIQKPEGRNEPDWATKIHVAIYPVYYYNYQLGGILAAQYLQAITAELGLANFQEVDFCNNYQMGQFMIEKIFRPGKKYRWDEFIRRATGENLSSKYFVEQL